MRTKKHRDELVEWAHRAPSVLLWWQDAGWFSRFVQCSCLGREAPPHEPNKVLAGYGAVGADTGNMHLAFDAGQPKSEYTLTFLPQSVDIGRQAGKPVGIVVWDHARWHKSKRVRWWLRAHHQPAKQHEDVRLIGW